MHANRYVFLFDYVFCIQDKCFRFLSDDKCFDEELIDNIKDSLHDGLLSLRALSYLKKITMTV